jgi:dGTPase
MRTRQDLERIENLSLAPYAARCAASRGREHPEPEAPYRTAFQRDRERVLHTTAFRRLQGKTQVFVVTEGDYYRNRITHTLEVAQIGRTVARALGANEDLVEGVCLAHDLGHPPFGHSGEMTLAALMRDHGGFDHNRHSYRIITALERRYPAFPGLNLTYEFREGIVKHETEYDQAARSGQDYALELRGSLEAQIASFADELAYNAHDLDDGLRAGLLDPREAAGLAWWRRAWESAGLPDGEPFTDLTRHRLVRRLIGEMVTDLIAHTSARLESAGVASIDDVRRQPGDLMAFPDATRALNRELKAYLYRELYEHPRVLRMHAKAQRVVTELFRAYTAEPRMLPEPTRGRLDAESRERVVCDYIAGMTDRFAFDEYARLFDPHERV